MAGPGNSFLGGPLRSGTKPDQTDFGVAVLMQSVTLNQNSTTAVSGTMTVPPYSKIVDLIIDTTTAWNSVTSAVLSVGTAAAGTQYAGSVDVKAGAARQTPTFTTTQLAAMNSVGTNVSVVATVTPTGATSAGSTIVTMLYVQTVQTTSGVT